MARWSLQRQCGENTAATPRGVAVPASRMRTDREPRQFLGSLRVAAVQPAPTYGHLMDPTEHNHRDPLRWQNKAEPSSWWIFIAIVLGIVGVFATLVVHLLLDATRAGPWGLAWMAIPVAFIAASVGALFVASGLSLREKLAVIPAALLGYSPRERSRKRSTPAPREAA
jgi:hypothetical protein